MRATKANDFHTVHKMARMLAQRRRGGRKRVFGRHDVPGSQAEWTVKMKKSGPSGGCSAVEVTLEQVREQRGRVIRQWITGDELETEMKGIKKAMWKARLWRASPAWSSSVELLRCLLSPQWVNERMATRRPGVGHESEIAEFCTPVF